MEAAFLILDSLELFRIVKNHIFYLIICVFRKNVVPLQAIMKVRKHIIFFLLIVLTGCSSTALHEAQMTLAEADSLRAQGITMADSTRIAEAVSALTPWRYSYPEDYAKASYYYARLLKNKEHYFDAMLCLIEAVRATKKDAVLSGRIYTNMADICHLEGSYDLSSSVFQLAATAFLSAQDTIAYGYALCDVAVEEVQTGNFFVSDSLLTLVENLTADSGLFAHCHLSRAIMYRHMDRYDSALVCADLAWQYGYRYPAGYVVKAQAFSHLGQKDSAVCYARKAAETSHSLFDLNNMYYILANDSGQSIETILQLNAQRADIQKALEVRQGELSRAVDKLVQYLETPYDWRRLYFLFGIAALAGAFLYVYLMRRRHPKLWQDIVTNRQLTEQLHEERKLHYETAVENFEHNCEVLREIPNLERELCWNDYNRMCEIVNRQLFFLVGKLSKTGVLSEKEMRLCILVAINVSYRQMSHMIPYSFSGISKFKYTTSKKLGVSVKEMRQKLINLAVEGTTFVKKS